MSGQIRAARWMWFASELRRRWAALVMLGVLGGLAAGLAVAAFDGASRSGSSYTRMRASLNAADAVFFPSQAGVGDADVTKLGSLEEVEAWAGFAINDSHIDELPADATPIIAVGDGWYNTIERAKVIQGRLPNPAADDEVVVNEPALASGLGLGLHVGSVLTWRNPSKEDVEAHPDGFPPDFDWTSAHGPVTTMHIVGVVRQPMESVVSFASGPSMWTGPGWAAAHLADTAVSFTNALVRLRHGAADVPRFQADIAQLYGRNDLPVKDLSVDVKRVQRSVDLERTALLLFGGAVVAAGIVLVGQALLRSVRAGAAGLPVLRAMGLDRSALTLGLVAPHLVSLAVTVVIATAADIALSSRFPIGLARRLDPDLGVHMTALTFVATIVVTGLVFLLGAVGLAALTVRGLARTRAIRRSRLVGDASRAGLPIPPSVGASMAFEQAPRQNAPVRPALVAAIVGVVAVVGATTLVGGIDDAVHEPARVGTVWDLEAYPNAEADLTNLESMAPSHDIAGVTFVSRWPTTVGNLDAPLYAFFGGSGKPIQFVALHGRAPAVDDEVALGPRTASLLHAHIGDTVAIGPDQQSKRIVGIALLMQTPHTSFDEGAWVTPAVIDKESGQTIAEREGAALLRLQPGADRDAVMASLNQTIYTTTPSPAPDVLNLASVRHLPLWLAAFLVVLAVGAVGHTLLSGARHRAHDLAVLRALGITPRQASACVAWQATIIAIVAIAIGLPLGLVIGRGMWRLVADSLSFSYVRPVAPLALALVGPATLILCWILAAWPARSAGRRSAAEALRTE